MQIESSENLHFLTLKTYISRNIHLIMTNRSPARRDELNLSVVQYMPGEKFLSCYILFDSSRQDGKESGAAFFLVINISRDISRQSLKNGHFQALIFLHIFIKKNVMLYLFKKTGNLILTSFFISSRIHLVRLIQNNFLLTRACSAIKIASEL